MADPRGRLDRGHGCRAVEALAHVPGLAAGLRGVLEIAAGHVEADRVAIDEVHHLVGRDIRPAALERDDEFDLVMQVPGGGRVGQGRAVGDDGVRRLGEEERILAGRVAAHLAGMGGVVAADAIDATDREARAFSRDLDRGKGPGGNDGRHGQCRPWLLRRGRLRHARAPYARWRGALH